MKLELGEQKFREQCNQTSALVGAGLWGVLAALAGAGRAPLGVIELLFLFAPLVVVPLGQSLAGVIAPAGSRPLEDAARTLQPLAAGLAVASFWFSPGPRAAALAGAWALVCGLLALGGARSLLGGRARTLREVAVSVGRLDLALAAAWLLASRLGIHPLGIQEPIGLLTAVHFHFTGFGTATLAAAVAAFARRINRDPRTTHLIVALVVFLPFLLAAGFVLSPILKVVAAVMLSLAVTALGLCQLRLAPQTNSPEAAGFLRLSSLAIVAGATLAGVYAIGDWLGTDWLTIPRMAGTHGWLNSLGFVLPGLLGWLVEWQVRTAEEPDVNVRVCWRTPSMKLRVSVMARLRKLLPASYASGRLRHARGRARLHSQL